MVRLKDGTVLMAYFAGMPEAMNIYYAVVKV